LMGTRSETPRDFMGTYRRFGGTCRLYLQCTRFTISP